MTASSEKVGKALADDGHRAGVTIFDLRYDLEDKPAPIPSILFGLQHVLIMFTAMIASPLVIGQLLNLPPDTRTTMVTGVMLGCGIGTVISALGIAGWAADCRCCSVHMPSTSDRWWRLPRARAWRRQRRRS
jgi:hypothetical protein